MIEICLSKPQVLGSILEACAKAGEEITMKNWRRWVCCWPGGSVLFGGVRIELGQGWRG